MEGYKLVLFRGINALLSHLDSEFMAYYISTEVALLKLILLPAMNYQSTFMSVIYLAKNEDST